MLHSDAYQAGTAPKCRVVIVGASVTGLTLANAFQKLGIDHVVLEGGDKVVPQVGAGISIWPNGGRILDQLGCYEPLLALIGNPLMVNYMQMEGRTIVRWVGVAYHVLKRHGYLPSMISRQVLVQTLYNNLKDQDRILTGKRVNSIVVGDDEVLVETADGDKFVGDMVVGADGIHSAVRREMHRIGHAMSPGYFPTSKQEKVTAYYRCFFGISTPRKSIRPYDVFAVMGDGFSYLIAGGPDCHSYWFLYEKLPKPLCNDEIPRYSQADADAFVAKHGGRRINPETTFGDLYSTRQTAVLSPLHEHVFKKWSYKRVMTLGDAAHKFHPLTGHGGSSAIESVATFVNQLTRKMEQVGCVPGSTVRLSESDIEAVCRETQEMRAPRAQWLVDVCHRQQMVEALQIPLIKYIIPRIASHVNLEMRQDRFSMQIVDATRIEKLPTPPRPRYIPFTDELPAKPVRGMRDWLMTSLAMVTFGRLFYVAACAFGLGALPTTLSSQQALHPDAWTGIPHIHRTISTLLSFAASSLASTNSDQRAQFTYFLAMLGPAILVWTIEGHRRGNAQNIMALLVSWPSLFAVVYQLYGVGKLAPLYFAISALTARSSLYARTTGRIVDPFIARALLPALCIGYVLPTSLMLAPHADPETWRPVIAAWYLSPAAVPILVALIANLLRRLFPNPAADTRIDPHARARAKLAASLEASIYTNADVAPLQTAYLSVFWAALAAHVSILLYALLNGLSLPLVFGLRDVSPLPLLFLLPAPAVNNPASVSFLLKNPRLIPSDVAVDDAVFAFFRADMALFLAAVTFWCLWSVWELRRLGYVTTRRAWQAAALCMTGVPVAGPGAVYAGLWYWREGVIAGLSEMRKG